MLSIKSSSPIFTAKEVAETPGIYQPIPHKSYRWSKNVVFVVLPRTLHPKHDDSVIGFWLYNNGTVEYASDLPDDDNVRYEPVSKNITIENHSPVSVLE